MSEKQRQLMDKLEAAAPNIPAERMDYFVGFVDGVSAMCTPDKNEVEGEEKKVKE